MNYIVVDLEWNQALSSNSSVFNHLPIHLRGEIIEIGAVKLNADMTPGEEFTADIKPIYFKKMHYKVKKITGFDKERLDRASIFPDVFEKFREWCGNDAVFITWGFDDQGIMEQNIIIHDQDWDWINSWINLQLIYNVQTGEGREQKSLQTAMEHFGIEQTRVAHDALGDAYNTALICSMLDMESGLRDYQDAAKILAERSRVSKPEPETEQDITAISSTVEENLDSKAAAFSSEIVNNIVCPVCASKMKGIKWVNQGDQRYINLYSCDRHGDYFIRLKFRKHNEGNVWDVRRIIYLAEDDKKEIYNTKLKQARRRGRVHTGRKNRPA